MIFGACADSGYQALLSSPALIESLGTRLATKMDKYVRKAAPARKRVRDEIHDCTASDSDIEEQPPPRKVSAMRAYKNNLRYDSAWKKKYSWIQVLKVCYARLVKNMERHQHKPEVLRSLGL